MGNSLCGNNDPCYNHVTLGSHAFIDTTKEMPRREYDGGYSQGWTTSYTILESWCTLYLKKFVDQHNRVSEVFLELEDDTCFGGGVRIWINRFRSNFLDIDYRCAQSFLDVTSFNINRITNPRGIVITTRVFRYGRGSRGGLIVLVSKRERREDANPYATTVAHYYAISRGNMFGQNKIDIGLSMVVNIRASNKNLEYRVEGPVRHPASALFYMFEQVVRCGNWKLTTCPHCADVAAQRQCNDSDESENEDNEKKESENRNNLPPTAPSSSLHGPGENKSSTELINNKDINGNGNGNRIGRDQKFKLSAIIPINLWKKS